jgi:NAD(P)-dependent dehydrogenase (short-subunit alcohol dehydrogenase family)
VTVSSLMHRRGKIDFDDLQGERGYSRWGAYQQSKLANLMFCFELQRRAVEAGSALVSVAAHPGYAATNLQAAGTDRLYERVFMAIGNRLFAQSADMGALPTLYAATVPDLPGGTFVGPGGRGEQRGHPKVVGAAGKAYDEQAWRRLWEVSEQLTGVHYEWGASRVTA